jgi:hypothetical protein
VAVAVGSTPGVHAALRIELGVEAISGTSRADVGRCIRLGADVVAGTSRVGAGADEGARHWDARLAVVLAEAPVDTRDVVSYTCVCT